MAGEEGFEPPHPVLETGGLPLNLLPCTRPGGHPTRPHRAMEIPLLHFLMRGVLAARVTELPRLQPVLVFLPVLHGGVVPVFTIATLQCNNFAHIRIFLSLAMEPHADREAWRLTGKMFYSMISVTAPAPTVWPPSRIAKRSPFSNATGVISEISADILSPGITISTPSGSFTSPVTSVVRK
jgi:hypothetical protein